MKAVRPLMQGTRSLGQFTADLIDMGLPPATGAEGEKTALQLRKSATWKGYANGSDPMPPDVASELASRWEQFEFSSNVMERYGEDALIKIAGNLHELDSSINKGNCPEGLGRLFFNVFHEISGAQVPALTPQEAVIERIEKSGSPYIDRNVNRLRLGDDSIALPRKREVPTEVQDEELGYVTPLLEAYCEAQCKAGQVVSVADIPKRLAVHFQEQRQAFYSTEWLKEASWNCFQNGEGLFETWLENMYAGVNDTHLRSYASAVDRLMETLAQSTRVQLDGVQLAQIIGLIDVWVRKGACHELAARQKLRWAE